MKKFYIATDMWIPKPIDEVWNILTHTDTLIKISPPHLKVQLGEGARTETGARFKISFAFPMLPIIRGGWTVRIPRVEGTGSHRIFVDEQEGGPFSHWRHEHIFEQDLGEIQPQSGGPAVKSVHPGTWVRDRVEYALPLGIWGQLAHQIFVKKELQKMFFYRREKTREMFGV